VVGFTAPTTWPKELKKVWSEKVGEGLASPALVDGKLYTFTRKDGHEVITCIDVGTGKAVWEEKYEAPEPSFPGARGKFIGPRSSPVVGEGKVCTFGVVGKLTCFDAKTGKQQWQKEGGEPKFATSSSPVIAEGKCIVFTGGDGGGFGKGKGGGGKGGQGGGKGQLTAYDLATGEPKWQMKEDGPGYGSPVIATIGNVKQVVVLGASKLMGVALADGKLLWSAQFKQGRYQTATPIIEGDIVICSGTAFKIEKKGAEFTATQVWKDKAPATYNTPVLKDGVLYGYADAGRGSTRMYAQDAKTGKELWGDGARGGECGAILDAGSVMIALSSDGKLIVFTATKDGFTEIANYTVASGGTYAMPIIDGKTIYVKDTNDITKWTIE
jgi:outer membrane protein assembly factor BamB